ncbi:unnamed protein product, partial [Allacma fusca]
MPSSHLKLHPEDHD